MDLALRVADHRPQPVPEREALVCGDREPAGGAEGLQGPEGRRRDPDAVADALSAHPRTIPFDRTLSRA